MTTDMKKAVAKAMAAMNAAMAATDNYKSAFADMRYADSALWEMSHGRRPVTKGVHGRRDVLRANADRARHVMREAWDVANLAVAQAKWQADGE